MLGDPCAAGNTTLSLKPNLLPLDNGTYSYFWTGPNGFVGRNNQVNLSGLGSVANGTYQLYILSANNCQSKTASYQVNLGNRPSKPAPPFNQEQGLTACLNNSFVLRTSPFSGSGNISYHWRLPDGRLVETKLPVLEINKVSFSDEGDYSVFIRNNGCNSDTSLVSKVSVKPLPILSVTSNAPVCAGSTLRLNASQFDGATYKWTGPNNFTSTSAGVVISQIQQSNGEGNFSVVMTVNGCSTNPVIIPVTVLPAEVLPALEPVKDVCTNKQTSISLKIPAANYLVGATYVWYADGVPIDSGKQSLTTIQNLTPFIGKSVVFSVKQKGSLCSSESTTSLPVTISSIPNERAVVENNFAICAAPTINIKAQATSFSQGSWRLWRASDNSVVDIKMQMLLLPV